MRERNNSQWEPDHIRYKDLIRNIDRLKDDETLFISHAGCVIKVNGVLIGIDPPSPLGRKFPGEANTLLPPHNGDNLSFAPSTRHYSFNLYDHSPETAAAAIGSRLQYVFITHMDDDHFSARDLLAMIKANPAIQIFVPPEFIRELAKHNPEVPPNFHTIFPRSTAINEAAVPPGLENFYPGLPDNSQVTINAGQPGKQITITSFETPHIGGDKAPFVQSLVVDTDLKRKVIISDCAFSPELIKQVYELHSQKAIDQIVISAKFNPSSIYRLIPPGLAHLYRQHIEELYQHSAFIVPALCLATQGSANINIFHQGEFHYSKRGIHFLPNRLGEWSGEDPEKWLKAGYEFISGLLTNPDLDKLVPFTGYRYDTGKSLKRFMIRYWFSQDVQNWIKSHPIPKNLIHLFSTPGPNEIVHF